MADHPTRDDIDLLEGSFYVDDPATKYTWMRANAPVYYDAPRNVWGFASYAAVLAASKDPKTFSNAGGIRPDNGPIPMMIDMDDPEHWKRRKLVNRGFTPGRVRDSEQNIRDVANSIIDAVCERGECDFVQDIAAPLPMILIGDMLGVAPEDRDDLLRWSDDMVSSQSSSATEAQYDAAMNAMIEYNGFCEHAGRAAARRTRRRPDERARPRRGRRRPPRRPRHPPRVPAHPHRRRRDDPSRHQRRHGAAAAAPGAAEVAAGRSRQDPRRGRGDVALGQPDQEHVPHGDARRRVHGPAAPRRAEVHAALRVGEPRRDAVHRATPVRRRASAERARRVRVRRALLPRSGARRASSSGSCSSSC